MKNVPIWAFHGADDKTVPADRSREMIDALKAVGATPKYTEYPGVGHNSWSQTYSNPEFYAWLFAQRKP
jgi:predicted peptidase